MSAYRKYPGLQPTYGRVAVPCSTCNAAAGERCRKGGWSRPALAHQPHKAREQAANLVAWWEDFGRKPA